MTKSVTIFALAGCFLCGACSVISVLSSKSYYEQKEPAEFMLKDVAEGGVLIYVDEAGAGKAELKLRPGLSEAAKMLLVKKARIESENFVSPERLSQLRRRREDFALLSPVELGREAGAAVVLYILVEKYELYAIDERAYHGGSLSVRSILFDVESGRVLWPVSGGGRVVNTRVEIETGGRQAALNRLISAAAHIITRNLYDCRKPEYRISDEEGGYRYENW
ncbi:MAG: hypothetical protein ACYTFK_04165 [Planctomycetota bacterium]|jgi:hypothetical protein